MAPETRRGKRGRGDDLEGRPWEPPRQVKRNLGPQSDRLCAQCTKLKLDAVFSGRRPVLKGHVMKNLGPVATWAIDSCCLCSLLAALIPSSERQRTGYKLRLLSADRFLSTINTTVLKLDSSGHSSVLIPQAEGENCVRLLKEDSIDFDILLGWLCRCQDEHTETCSLQTSPRVPFLKLIDCHTRRIVPALDNQYLALSYTWGPKLKSAGKDNDLDILPDDLPDTIEDAITVTRNLGFQYLWVDRYCINQQNEKEASAQIRQMDLVYKNAEITIIAAAGKDPQYGLPGVSRRHRASQPRAKIGEYFLVSALDDLSYCIQDSPWVSRAWTYQEGLLSRRRLIFTDQQVYYECRSKCYAEARLTHLPVRTFHYIGIDGPDMFPFSGIGKMPWDIMTRIEEYSRKSLTNDSDILNGILGILRAFETSIHATRHCWGVPILSVPPEIIKSATKSGKKNLGAQAWGFVAGLSWILPKPSTRRLGFPSWSWTGWAGSVKWGIDNSSLREITIDPDIKLSIELRDGRILDWDTYQQSYDDLNSSLYLTQYIRISAWTTPIRLLRRTRSLGRVEYEAHIDLEDGSYLHWRFCPTTKEPLAYQLYTGIHLGWKEEQGMFDPNGPLILVVGRVGGRTERVGFGWVDDDNYKLYGPDGVYEHADEKDSVGLLGRNRLDIRKPILAKSSQEIRLG